jgi:hypothetical protein
MGPIMTVQVRKHARTQKKNTYTHFTAPSGINPKARRDRDRVFSFNGAVRGNVASHRPAFRLIRPATPPNAFEQKFWHDNATAQCK